MQGKKKTNSSKQSGKNTLTFHYMKSPTFRVVRADGVVGNISPRGDVFLCFYNERFALPDRVTHEINEIGVLGEQVSAETKSPGVVRELETGFTLDLQTARSMILWLSEIVAQGDKVNSVNAEETPELKS